MKKKYRLKEIGTIYSGGTPSTKESEYWNGNISWITPKDLSKYSKRYIESGERNITKLGIEKSGASLIPKNSILLSSRAPIGYLVINSVEVTTNQGFKAINPDEKICYFLYLYYYFKSNISSIKDLGTGTTFMEISKTVFGNIEINLPPIKEQERIANIISSYDDKIENNIEIIDTLENIASLLYKRWFIDFEFPNKDGKPYKSNGGIMVESELGLIPKGWEVIKLEDHLEFKTGFEPGAVNYSNKNDGNIHFFRVKDLKQKQEIYIKRDLVKKNSFVDYGEVLVSFDGTIGRVANNMKGCYSSGIKKVFSENENFQNSIIYYIMKSFPIQNIIKEHATGTTIKHASSSIPYLVIPYNKKKYDAFNNEIKHLYELIVLKKEENEILTNIRDLSIKELIK